MSGPENAGQHRGGRTAHTAGDGAIQRRRVRTGAGPTSEQDQRIRAQRFGFDGTKIGNAIRANTVAGLHRAPIVAGLTNGNFVIGWRARLPGPLHRSPPDVRRDGHRWRTEQTTKLDVTDITMAPLDTGPFVIAHVRSALDGETGFDTTIDAADRVRRRKAPSSTTFPATNPQRIQSAWPTLAPFPGGRFLLAWTEMPTSITLPPERTSRPGSFRSQGPLGQAITVNTLKRRFSRFSVSAATTSGPEGETAFLAWTDDTQSRCRQVGSRDQRPRAA